MVSREFVLAARRRRFAAAVAEICDEFGPRAITVDALCRLTTSARTSFYEAFGAVNDCLYFAVADSYERLFAPVREAEDGGGRLRGTEAAITGFYEAVAADPPSGSLFLIHSFPLGLPPDATGFETGVAALASLLERERLASAGALRVSPLADEYWARVVLSAARQALLRDEAAALPKTGVELARIVRDAYAGCDSADRS
jgi:AcrR family transcriptional regulator